MLRRLLFFIPILLIAGAITATWVYAQNQPVFMLPGTVIAGMDVSGLSKEQSAAKLQAWEHKMMDRTIVARVSGKKHTVTAEQAGLTVNSKPALDAAWNDATNQDILHRAYNTRKGTTHQVPVTWNKAPRGLLRTIAKWAKDTRVTPVPSAAVLELSGPVFIKGKKGRALHQTELFTGIQSRLKAKKDGTVKASFDYPRPQTWTKNDAAKTLPASIIASQSAFRVRLYKGFRLEKTYGIAVGMPAHPTPNGRFTISNRQDCPVWSVPRSEWAGSLQGQIIPCGDPKNPILGRWLGVTDGVGFHGTADRGSIGSRASHGCLRMHIEDVKDLYPRVPLNTPVIIHA